MDAIWLENKVLALRRDIERPEPASSEALIKTRLAGICSTDLELVKGYYPYRGVLGHEFVGQVVNSPGHPEWEGKRVVGDINLSCGKCGMCRSGNPHHCENRRTLGITKKDGVFADYFTLPVENLFEVPESIPDEAAVFSEPLAAALEIQNQIQISPEKQVLVIGAGRLGLLIALSLSLTGCDLKVVARRSRPCQILKAHHIKTISVKEIANNQADIVVEVTGSADGFALARRAVRPAGIIVMKSTFKGLVQVDLASIVVDEVTIVGSRCGSHPPAIRTMQMNAIDPRELIDRIYPISEGIDAIKEAGSPGVLKILLRPDSKNND